MKSRLNLFLTILTGLVLIAAMAGSVLVPMPPSSREQITLGGTRSVVCAVGPSGGGSTVGTSTVHLTDAKDLTAHQVGGAGHDPDSLVTFEAAEKPVVADGTPMLGGVTIYSDSGKTAMVPCVSPASYGIWNGVPINQSATLVLTNVDPAPAVVDVFLLGQSGPIPVPGLRDINISAGSTGTLLLDPLTSSPTPITVVMRVSKGRIAGTIRMAGDAGIEWMAPQPAAESILVITGIPAVEGSRVLTVTNAGDEKATFTLKALTESGDFLPLGDTPIDVSALDVLEMDVTQAIGTQATTLVLTSTAPISASITVKGSDIAIISAQGPLGAGLTFPGVESATLWLSNPTDKRVIVTVASDDGQGNQESTQLVLPPESTASTPYPETGRVVLTAESEAAVHAALVVTGTSVSVIPLTSGSLASVMQVPDLDPGLG
ncbi:MAG: DUF5719 family protein [Propionibacteriaceae bacterium]|jgi:hypothetical protein|nr:DUF5719 family protein [Propionibacteriaceae bacterium]